MICNYCEKRIEEDMEYYEDAEMNICEDCIDEYLDDNISDIRYEWKADHRCIAGDDDWWADRETQEYIEGRDLYD